ncbi:hypothetical protein CsSME_00035665 [Camellia sinensis var. sinensis]
MVVVHGKMEGTFYVMSGTYSAIMVTSSEVEMKNDDSSYVKGETTSLKSLN